VLFAASTLFAFSGRASAVLYEFTDLGTLGGNQSRAYAINTAGQVAGFAFDAANRLRATLWSNGTVTDLNSVLAGDASAFWELLFAYGINDSGQIVGEARSLVSSEQRAFLLTPTSTTVVPLPGSLLLALGGLGVMVAIARRRKSC
jgi:probable HAF family extracellular repeat protein